jgi:hypothetical protein
LKVGNIVLLTPLGLVPLVLLQNVWVWGHHRKSIALIIVCEAQHLSVHKEKATTPVNQEAAAKKMSV